MSEKFKTILAILIILIVLPYIITYAIQGNALFQIGEADKTTDSSDEEADGEIGRAHV